MITAPIRVSISKRKTWALNLNSYRNTHFQVLNKAKIAFKQAIWPQIHGLPVYGRIRVAFTLYMPTQRRCDVSNICCIVDKFFMDALVTTGKLPDDNYNYLPEVRYIWGGFDKKKPRVEIEIIDI